MVNRFGQDNITILDPARLTDRPNLDRGRIEPAGRRPVGDRLYVAALAAPGLLVIDPTRPDEGVVDTIDLSRLDPKDGLPDCVSVVAVGDQVVAVCSVLDESFTPRGPGQVALIAGGKVVDTVPMTQVRPFGLAQAAPAGDSVLITTVLDFADLDAGGCVERVAIGKGTLEASACLVDSRPGRHGQRPGLEPGRRRHLDDRDHLVRREGFRPARRSGIAPSRRRAGARRPARRGAADGPGVCPTGHLVISMRPAGCGCWRPEPSAS